MFINLFKKKLSLIKIILTILIAIIFFSISKLELNKSTESFNFLEFSLKINIPIPSENSLDLKNNYKIPGNYISEKFCGDGCTKYIISLTDYGIQKEIDLSNLNYTNIANIVVSDISNKLFKQIKSKTKNHLIFLQTAISNLETKNDLNQEQSALSYRLRLDIMLLESFLNTLSDANSVKRYISVNGLKFLDRDNNDLTNIQINPNTKYKDIYLIVISFIFSLILVQIFPKFFISKKNKLKKNNKKM